MKLLALGFAAVALHGSAAATPVQYVASRQQPDGGFAEPGGRSTAGLTAWAVLALKAAGQQPARPTDAAAFLARQEPMSATDLELTTLAISALGHPVDSLAGQIAALRRPDGRIGALTNSTTWGVLALRAAGKPVDPATVHWLVHRQSSSGGWSWYPGGRPDSDDTAITVQALRSVGVPGRSRVVTRALSFIRTTQNRDGGFGQTHGAPSNAQSTAWALQAFAAAGRNAGSAARAYLRRLRRADGSYRYSARYATTPLWVTSQVVPALLGRPFPLG